MAKSRDELTPDEIADMAAGRAQRKLKESKHLRSLVVEWETERKRCYPDALPEHITDKEAGQLSAMRDTYGKEVLVALMRFAIESWFDFRREDDVILRNLDGTPTFPQFYKIRDRVASRWSARKAERRKRREEQRKLKAAHDKEDAARAAFDPEKSEGLTHIRQVIAALEEKKKIAKDEPPPGS